MLVLSSRYWAPFGFLALVPFGYRLGHGGCYLLVAALPAALLVFDGLLGDDEATPRDDDGQTALHRLAPWLYIPLQIAMSAWAAGVIARPATPLVEAAGLTVSLGLAAGVFGFISAHEMVHSRRPAERALGLAMLALLLDMQFAISHVEGHHRRAATWEDPATARRGEALYPFLVRSIFGQIGEAWGLEARRLARAGRAPLGPRNRLVVYAAVEAGLVLGVGIASWRALAFVIAEAVIAICLLESFNYVAHYGLVRRRHPDGRLEPLRPWHSWSTSRRMNNASLFNMGRHADHHRFSARPYHALEPLDGSAELPSGYAAALFLALVPPLWRKVMDPRVDRVMSAHPLIAHSPLPQRPRAALDSHRQLAQFPATLAGETGREASFEPGAEGATAPETLRQKDRAG